MIKSRKTRIYPNATQRAIYRKWFGAARYVYNQTVEYLNSLDGPRDHWTVVAAIILAGLPEWAREIPYQIKKIAVKDACQAYSSAKLKTKNTGIPFSLKFRSRKNPQQSCFIPKPAVKTDGIYPTVSGRGMLYSEALPEHGDCRLIWRQGRWFVSFSFKTTARQGENQARVVALDPGVRTFLTFFSPEMAGWLGYHDFGKIVRLCQHLDNLLSRISKCTDKKRRYRMRKAADRMRWKIRDLRDELHHKSARFLVDNFDVILLPTFEVSGMVRRSSRKIRSKTVRSMLNYAHFQFKRYIKGVAAESGKIVVNVCEAYTSKTCSWSGEVVKVGSSEIVRGSDGVSMHRDMNGARGIFLRALRELSTSEFAVPTRIGD